MRETGRIWSVALGRLTSPAVRAALDVARSGELGRLVSLTSLAPHRLNRALRPDWFFEQAAYGGIINDIGVHSIDQFVAFAGSADVTIAASTIGCFGTAPAGFEDFAEITLRAGGMTGTMRLDWFTPDGLPDWGDGRWRPHVRREPCPHALSELRRSAGDLLPRFPGRRAAAHRTDAGRRASVPGLPAGVAVPGASRAVHAVIRISVRPMASTLRR